MSVFTGMAGALPGPARREAEEFAALLDDGRAPAGHDLHGLVALARGLAPATHAPSPEFRSALRERLVDEAATRTPSVPTPRRRTGAPPVPAGRPRLRSAVATVLVAAVVAGAGAAAASTRALPGDVLYGLKRQIESAQLALAGSDLGRGREHLEQADARLGEVEALAASSSAGETGTRERIASTLGEMERSTAAGTVELTDAYRETGDPEPMLLLDRFVADQRLRLGDLLAVLDPSLRARVRAQLDALARLATETGAVLGARSVALPGVSTQQVSASSRDGWAVSRSTDYAASSRGAPATSPAGTGAVTSLVGGGSGSGDGGLLDALPDVAGDGSSRSSPSPRLGGGTASVPPVGSVTSPLPSIAPTPLPSVSPTPLPTATTTSAVTSVPVPCVPVPPLTSC